MLLNALLQYLGKRSHLFRSMYLAFAMTADPAIVRLVKYERLLQK